MPIVRLSTWIVLAVLLCGCDHEDPCGDGVSSGPGTCRAATPDSGSTTPDSGEDDEMDAGASADSGTMEESLGETCAGDGDCASDAPFCARMPGAPNGYCTIRDCSTTDDECPTGYRCFSIGIPSVPPFCMKQ